MWFKSAGSNSVSTGNRRSAPSILSEGFRVDGDKYYSTGSLYADWNDSVSS